MAQVTTGMTQTVFPVLRYKDADAAIEWLKRTFGAGEQLVVRNEDGSILHAEMTIGDGIVLLSSAKDDVYSTKGSTQLLYVSVTDTDAYYERAKSAGAEIVSELTTTSYGSRDFSARDLEGHLWSFGTYNPLNNPQPE